MHRAGRQSRCSQPSRTWSASTGMPVDTVDAEHPLLSDGKLCNTLEVPKTLPRDVRDVFRRQHGVAGRHQLVRLGVAAGQVRARLRSGEWEAVGRKVVRAGAAPLSPEQALWIAILAGGPEAVASHASAAWLWGLAAAPSRPVITVPRGGPTRAPGAVVRRPSLPVYRVSTRWGLPCTDPLRTIVDLAVDLDPADLDGPVDRAIVSRLVSVEGLFAEIDRSARPGRRGPAALRETLDRRGFGGKPPESVLESRFLRLCAWARLGPVVTQVTAGPAGCYRIDAQVGRTVFVELDGYAFHASPEQKTADERRRNRLRLEGRVVLVYTWTDIVHDGHRVVAEIREALAHELAAG